MNIQISKLHFSLPANLLDIHIKKVDQLSNSLDELTIKAGTSNSKFGQALAEITHAIESNKDLPSALDSPIKIRALAILLQDKLSNNIILNKAVFNKIDLIKPNPSTLFVETLYQYYLKKYDQISNYQIVAEWLLKMMQKKGLIKNYHQHLLKISGPRWLAIQSIDSGRDFSNQLTDFELDNYTSGRFLTVAKQIYFVEQLKHIPANEDHELLLEVQNESVFDSRYDNKFLLGHKVLQILIKRAPTADISDSWLNVIMAIGGDPRIPKSHPKYRKWWSALDEKYIQKVKGWLSRLDLRLFLEALENYSDQAGKTELKRMFPSRKHFLEGLQKRKKITHTRLYLSSGAIRYLRKNYDSKHLPAFSKVSDGDRSIIHVEMGESHIIEGTHNCYLWIYQKLNKNSIVFDYKTTSTSYHSLTQGLSWQTSKPENITHNPSNFSWQRKAIQGLNSMGINIKAKDVLSEKDYLKYKRLHGLSNDY